MDTAGYTGRGITGHQYEGVETTHQDFNTTPINVLSCGTAFRATPGRKSIHQADLQRSPGPIEVRIERLGTLVNPVIIDDTPLGDWRLARRPGLEA